MKVAAMSASNLMPWEAEGIGEVRGCWAAASYKSIKSNNSHGSLKKVARECRTELIAEKRNADFVNINNIYKIQILSQTSIESRSDLNLLTTNLLN